MPRERYFVIAEGGLHQGLYDNLGQQVPEEKVIIIDFDVLDGGAMYEVAQLGNDLNALLELPGLTPAQREDLSKERRRAVDWLDDNDAGAEVYPQP